ncbi:hypothetical protein ES703_113639 [subsurface metagenome]
MENILIKDIVKDLDIYPRRNESPKTIEAYAEALEAGAKFPPVLVQRISTNGANECLIFLDGVHRARAHERVRQQSIEAEYWKDEVLNKEEWITQLQLESARQNFAHGAALQSDDKQQQARKICEKNWDITEQEIADALGVLRRTVSNWVSDIKLKQKAERQAVIYRLNLLGWAQEEIAEALGLTHQAISEKLQVLAELPKLAKTFLDRGDSVKEVAEKLNLDLQLAWALALEGLDDQQRLEILNEKVEELSCKPRPYDVWNFGHCHKLMGHEYEGYIPGQLLLQLLYFYTKQRDLIVDPMAGSGTAVDACLLMNRRCLAYDNNPLLCTKRIDIRESDAIEAIKNLKHKANLIFLDPPYFKKKEKEYGVTSISSMARPEYLDYFTSLSKECIKKITPDGRVGLLMSDYTEDDPSESIFIHLYISRFEQQGFIVERIIQCPLPPEQLHADFYLKFTKSRKLGRLARYLVVFCATRPK